MAGMTGIAGALAVDPVGSVAFAGMLVDEHDVPLGGVHLIVSEEAAPDGALAGFQATTADDGSFTVQLYPWGTPDAPASVAIRTPPDQTVTREQNGCSQTVSVSVSDIRELALAGPADPPKPIDLVATTAIRGEACGTTATPPPDSGTGGAAGPTPRPRVTPPATDARPVAGEPARGRLRSSLALGFVAGLVAAAALVRPRRRRARPRR
jgi:hypothetical protein